MILMIGQAPSRASRPGDRALFSAAKKLGALIGSGEDGFWRAFETVNLLGEFPGKSGKGDAFDWRAAAEGAGRIDPAGREAVVACGRGVARALGVKAGFLEWTIWRGAPLLVLPHPSGVNHWWNDPENREAAAAALKKAAALIPAPPPPGTGGPTATAPCRPT